MGRNKWIRAGVHVVVISGADRGKVGQVLKREGDMVLVKDINIRKRHLKKQQNIDAGIIHIERGIHVSKVAISTQDGKKLKLKVRFGDGGSKDLVDYGCSSEGKWYRSLRKGKVAEGHG